MHARLAQIVKKRERELREKSPIKTGLSYLGVHTLPFQDDLKCSSFLIGYGTVSRGGVMFYSDLFFYNLRKEISFNNQTRLIFGREVEFSWVKWRVSLVSWLKRAL
jgi:hypothetical protein